MFQKRMWARKSWKKILVIGVLLLKFHRILKFKIKVDADKLHAFQFHFLLYEIIHKLIFS